MPLGSKAMSCIRLLRGRFADVGAQARAAAASVEREGPKMKGQGSSARVPVDALSDQHGPHRAHRSLNEKAVAPGTRRERNS